jgi:CheY-like chemotaxis protein
LRVVIALLDDLFFTVKIADAAKRSGMAVTFVKTEAAVFEHLQQQVSSLVVIDLNCASADPIALAARVKTEFPATPVIGFVSHVQTELRQQAERAGCDVVLARSVFSTRLPAVLLEYSN